MFTRKTRTGHHRYEISGLSRYVCDFCGEVRLSNDRQYINMIEKLNCPKNQPKN